MTNCSKRFVYWSTLFYVLLSVSSIGCIEEGGVESIAMSQKSSRPAKLTDGTAIPVATRPEVGEYNGVCTATLFSQQWFIMAAHCVSYGNPSGGTFSTGTHSYPVSRVYSLDDGVGAFDVAIGRLSTPVPASVATPARLAEIAPVDGEQVTVIGYGCNVRPYSGTFLKRYTTFNWGNSQRLCPGDSGGPVRRGSLNAAGEIIAVNSGYYYTDTNGNGNHDSDEPSGDDIYADVTLVKPRIESIVHSVDNQFDVGINRPGFDLSNVAIANTGGNGPLLCRNECKKLKACRAFSYSLSQQRCWFKYAVADGAPSSDVISGLPSGSGTFNRPGADYKQYSAARAEICEADCAADSNCEAYTFASGTCWLKSAVTNRTNCSTCATGSRRAFEFNTNRGGGDYAVITVFNDPAPCADACARDERCRAWTFVPANILATTARCYLKDEVRDPGYDAREKNGLTITSGVKRGMEANINRPGNDITSFFISTPEPQICQADCYTNASCKSWVYAPPGFGGYTLARCWLKDAIPATTTGIGLVSGRKGMEIF